MPLDAQLGVLERLRSLFAITGQHVEGELRIKNFLGLAFKREQPDGLLLQFVHAPGPALASRLEHVRDRTAYLVGGVQAPEDERNRDRSPIRDHVHGVARDRVSLWLDHWSAKARVRRFISRVSEIDEMRLGRQR